MDTFREADAVDDGAKQAVRREKRMFTDELLNKVALIVYRSRDADASTIAMIAPEPPGELIDRGVVLVVECDRARLQRLDLLLSQRGYTVVVAMTRARLQLSRLARALRPRAVLLERSSHGIAEVSTSYAATKSPSPCSYPRPLPT